MNLIFILLDTYLCYNFWVWSTELEKQERKILSFLSLFMSAYFGASLFARIL